MILTILKYFLLTLIVLVVVAGLIAAPFIISAKNEGDKMYAMYDDYTRETLARHFHLKAHPVKEEFQEIHPWKALKLFKVVVTGHDEGGSYKRVTSLDATIGLFMKMYTLLILPDYSYNLPMLSVDIIFIGGRRVFVIEVIDPARIEDENLATHFERMRAWMPEVEKLEQMTVEMDWAKDIVHDFSIHVRADRTNDELLFEIYQSYLQTYITMTEWAKPLSPGLSNRVQQGMEGYVDSLLARGGPAVNVFKTLLGPKKQQEYVRSVMFGLD
jgi:hypothetical protein